MNLTRATICILLLAAVICTTGCSHAPPTPAERRLISAQRLLQTGKFKQAREEVRRAIAADPSRLETYESAIRIYSSEEHYKDAIEVARMELKMAESGGFGREFRSEEISSIYGTLGALAWSDRDIAAAEDYLRKAVALSPNDPDALNELGYLYADESIHLDEALRLTRRAVKLKPDDGAIVDSLGWAQYKLKRYDDAVKTLERAVELNPGEAELRYHLGAAYLKTGQVPKARVELRKALYIDSDMTEAAALLKSIHK